MHKRFVILTLIISNEWMGHCFRMRLCIHAPVLYIVFHRKMRGFGEATVEMVDRNTTFFKRKRNGHQSTVVISD